MSVMSVGLEHPAALGGRHGPPSPNPGVGGSFSQIRIAHVVGGGRCRFPSWGRGVGRCRRAEPIYPPQRQGQIPISHPAGRHRSSISHPSATCIRPTAHSGGRHTPPPPTPEAPTDPHLRPPALPPAQLRGQAETPPSPGPSRSVPHSRAGTARPCLRGAGRRPAGRARG